MPLIPLVSSRVLKHLANATLNHAQVLHAARKRFGKQLVVADNWGHGRTSRSRGYNDRP